MCQDSCQWPLEQFKLWSWLGLCLDTMLGNENSWSSGGCWNEKRVLQQKMIHSASPVPWQLTFKNFPPNLDKSFPTTEKGVPKPKTQAWETLIFLNMPCKRLGPVILRLFTGIQGFETDSSNCSAKRGEPENYWKRYLVRNYSRQGRSHNKIRGFSEINSWKHFSGSAIIFGPDSIAELVHLGPEVCICSGIHWNLRESLYPYRNERFSTNILADLSL